MAGLIVRADAGRLSLAETSVDCIVTSPPYNVAYAGMSDELSPEDYRARAVRWTKEIARVLKPGGRAWVNVAQPLPELDGPRRDRWSPATLWHELLHAAGLLFRDWIVWRKVGAGAPTAWGSHLSPNAPNIRGRYELILLFFKDRWRRGRTEKNEIAPSVWGPWTQNVWDIPCATNRSGHPAPFPAELPRRVVLLSTWPGDVVLDPFCGSGTTIRVAKDLGRIGVGCELSELYCGQARARCAQEVLPLKLCPPKAIPGASGPASHSLTNAVLSHGEGCILPVAAKDPAPCRRQGGSLFRFSEEDAERQRRSLDPMKERDLRSRRRTRVETRPVR